MLSQLKCCNFAQVIFCIRIVIEALEIRGTLPFVVASLSSIAGALTTSLPFWPHAGSCTIPTLFCKLCLLLVLKEAVSAMARLFSQVEGDAILFWGACIQLQDDPSRFALGYGWGGPFCPYNFKDATVQRASFPTASEEHHW